MNVIQTALPEVLILEPRVFGDERGFFYESFNARAFTEATGLQREFVQDNHSRSQRGVLRGLHYQIEQAQGKLVRVTSGEVLDVAAKGDDAPTEDLFGEVCYRSGHSREALTHFSQAIERTPYPHQRALLRIKRQTPTMGSRIESKTPATGSS